MKKGTPRMELLAGTSKTNILIGSLGTTIIVGRAGNDEIFGDSVNSNGSADAIFGNRGDDVLFGCGGNDILSGGRGADFLSGGIGSDTLRGGRGSDIFNFEWFSGRGIDSIVDFRHSQDAIYLGIGPQQSSGHLTRNEFAEIVDYNCKTGMLSIYGDPIAIIENRSIIDHTDIYL